MNLETNPLDGKCDTRVKVKSRPLEIIYDAVSCGEVLNKCLVMEFSLASQQMLHSALYLCALADSVQVLEFACSLQVNMFANT